ncbi:MAG: hypothetical protein EHM53_11655 [Methanoregulaceae archaeon]|nr:MAG: hypothetical protein EHM53_11655 [Methanoregulaceae archaeon]
MKKNLCGLFLIGFMMLSGIAGAETILADFTGIPTSGTSPLDVQFYDLSKGTPSGWAWYFGDETYREAWIRQNVSSGWEGRNNHNSVAMPDGSIVLTGGHYYGGQTGIIVRNDTWQSTDKGFTWILQNNSSGWTERELHSSVVLSDGSIVLMGGQGVGGAKNDVWRSEDHGVTWTQVKPNDDVGWPARMSHSSVAMPDGSIVLTGGYITSARMNDVWRSEDKGATWTELTPPIERDPWGDWTSGGANWSPRHNHCSVAMPDGSIVLMGGYAAVPLPSGAKNDTWRSTDNGATWILQNGSSGWKGRFDFSCAAMPDGSIVIMGGGIGGSPGFTKDVWRSTNNGVTWTQLPDAGWTARGYHSSVVMPDGSIVLMGGWDSNHYFNDTWRFQPAGSSSKNPRHTYTGIAGKKFNVSLQVYNGNGYNSTRKTEYICIGVSALPLPGFANRPTDPDGDCIYEDLNANGRLDFADVVLYFNQMTWIAAHEPIPAFDLNGNGRIDFADIVALFNEI